MWWRLWPCAHPAADDLPAAVTVRHLGFRRNPLPFRARCSVPPCRPRVPARYHSRQQLPWQPAGPRAAHLLPRARVVSTIHNVYEGGACEARPPAHRPALAIHSAAVCHAAADAAILRRVLPRPKCSVIANGIDCGKFTPQSERRVCQRAHCRAHIGICLARCWPPRAGQGLSPPSARIRAGPARRPAGQALDRRRREPPLPGHLHTWPPNWPGRIEFAGSACAAISRELLDLADGFVLASAWEGMPLALGEAMAMEKRLWPRTSAECANWPESVATSFPQASRRTGRGHAAADASTRIRISGPRGAQSHLGAIHHRKAAGNGKSSTAASRATQTASLDLHKTARPEQIAPAACPSCSIRLKRERCLQEYSPRRRTRTEDSARQGRRAQEIRAIRWCRWDRRNQCR